MDYFVIDNSSGVSVVKEVTAREVGIEVITTEELRTIKARAEAATLKDYGVDFDDRLFSDADTVLMRHACEDILTLVAEIEYLEKQAMESAHILRLEMECSRLLQDIMRGVSRTAIRKKAKQLVTSIEKLWNLSKTGGDQ